MDDVEGHAATVREIRRVAADCSGELALFARHLDSGEEFRVNAGTRYGTASLIKVAVMAALYQRAEAGALILEELLQVSPREQVGGSGVLSLLSGPVELSLRDLCTLMITVSDNTATNVLVDRLGGVAEVNRTSAELGFPGLHLERKIGIPLGGSGGTGGTGDTGDTGDTVSLPLGQASPTAVVEFFTRLAQLKLVSSRSSQAMLATLRRQQNTDLVPRYFAQLAESDANPAEPDAAYPAVANKTGTVPGTRVDAGIVSCPGGTRFVYYAGVHDAADRSLRSNNPAARALGQVGAALLRRWWPGSEPPLSVPPGRGDWVTTAGTPA